MARVSSTIIRQALLDLDGVYDPNNEPERLALFDESGNPIVLGDPHGLPAGGEANQVLGKVTADDWDVNWVNAGGGAVIPGGTAGQVLSKASNDDGDVTWIDVGGGAVIPGGTTGQVLAKASDDDGDVNWVNAGGGAVIPGGTAGQVLSKASNTDGDVEWATPSAGGGTSRSYVEAVQSIPDLTLYLPLQTNLNARFGEDAIAIGGAAVAVDSSLPGGLGDSSVSFNGTNQALKVPLDLQSPSVTLFMWQKFGSPFTPDNILAELGPGVGGNNEFMIDMTTYGSFFMSIRGTSEWTPTWQFPSDKQIIDNHWHPLAVVMDRAFPIPGGGAVLEGYLDGLRQGFAPTTTNYGNANYVSGTLNLMSRNGVTMWLPGKLAHVAVFNRRLNAHEIQYLSTAHLFA